RRAARRRAPARGDHPLQAQAARRPLFLALRLLGLLGLLGFLGPGRGARGTAPAQGSGPALAAQNRGDLAGGPAAVPGDVGPAVSQRSRALHEVDIVPAGIAPPALGWVGGAAVQLDAQPVLLVQVVQVAVTAAVPAPGLPPGRRQAVGT